MASTSAEPAVAASALWPRIAPWLAGSVWVLAMGIHVAAVGVALGVPGDGSAPTANLGVQYAAGTLVVVSYLTVAVVLAAHRPLNVVSWIFAAIGSVAAVAELLYAVMLDALTSSPPEADRAALAGWAQPVVGTTAWTFLTFLLLLVFPNGRPISPRWGRLVWPALAAVLVMAIGLAFAPGRLVLRQAFENPLGMQGIAGALANIFRWLGLVVVFGLAIVAAWSVVLRYRSSTEVERQQLKWFALGSVVLAVVGTGYTVTSPLQAANPRLGDVAWIALCAAAALLPLAAAVGILRYGLFDIDRILSQTFVYGALTAILAGLYTASIRFFNWALSEVTGAESEAALVLTTLLLATTFTPIKNRLEDVVERRYKSTEASPAEDEAPLPRTRAELAELIREVIEDDRRRRRRIPSRRRGV